jgi:hypothetical protein
VDSHAERSSLPFQQTASLYLLPVPLVFVDSPEHYMPFAIASGTQRSCADSKVWILSALLMKIIMS